MNRIRSITFVFFIAALSLLSSCVFSLFPIYTDESIAFKHELIGKWQDPNDEDDYLLFEYMEKSEIKVDVQTADDAFIIHKGDTITDKAKIEKIWQDSVKNQLDNALKRFAKNKRYKLTVGDDSETIIYEAVLVEIGSKIFMDLYPMEDDKFIDGNFIPVHTFMRMETDGEQVVLTQFDMEKLIDLFESNKIRLRHEQTDDFILITAQPQEIQKFLRNYSNEKEVFEEPETYVKTGV